MKHEPQRLMTTARDQHSWFKVTQQDDGLFSIGEPGHFEEVFCFLLVGTECAILIDSGMGLYSVTSAVRDVTNLTCSVFNTHSHFDHVGSNSEFQTIWMLDHPNNRKAALQGFSAESLLPWITPEKFWGKIPDGMQLPYEIAHFPQAQFFKNRDVLRNDPFELTVMHTPGHSDDSVCFYEPHKGWLFVGDLIYDGPIYIEQRGGLAKYRSSIDLIASLSGVRKVLCSHNACEASLAIISQIKQVLATITTDELESEVHIGGRLKLIPV